MEEKVTLTYLYDFYGELLNKHQRKLVELYILDDLSFSEIAEQEGISRQGAHDIVRRSEKKLREYEEKLRLYEKYLTVKEKAEKARMLTCNEKLLGLLTEIVEAF